MSHTLLIADHSITIQRVIELTFADEDIRVVAVGDGGEAIAMLDQTSPDIVLADVGMPGRNGYEVARHIKATPRLAHIPVVLLTGAFEPIDQARVAEVGCDGVLQKPFEPQLVIARVKELLARPRDAGVQPGVPPPVEHRVEVGPEPEDASPGQTTGDVDNYFDRLDAALSHLAGSSQSRSPRPLESRAAAASDERLDTAATPETSVFPPLADAFAALLAAEQSGEHQATPPSWPGQRPALAPAVTAEIVDEVTRRVLDQLSDRVVRETVTEIVSASAERLVREEIERIKRQIE